MPSVNLSKNPFEVKLISIVNCIVISAARKISRFTKKKVPHEAHPKSS